MPIPTKEKSGHWRTALHEADFWKQTLPLHWPKKHGAVCMRCTHAKRWSNTDPAGERSPLLQCQATSSTARAHTRQHCPQNSHAHLTLIHNSAPTHALAMPSGTCPVSQPE
eukprot:1161228-Pelagomonas_calceolata.AAC.1